MKESKWLKNARVPGSEPFLDILIQDGRIARVGEGLAAEDVSVTDLGGRAVIPGLVEAHTHLDKAYTLSLCENREGTLVGAIRAMVQVKRQSSVEDIYRRAEACLLKFLSHGATTVRTHVDIDVSVGLRGVEALLRLREDCRSQVTLQVVAFASGASSSLETSKIHEFLEEAVRMGADAVGGVSALADDPKAHLDVVFETAMRAGLPVDLHVDESDDPRDRTLELVAEKTLAEGYENRVVAGHCCSLAAMDDATAGRIIEKTARARLSVITLPLCNLYLQGRRDRQPVRRGITRVRELMAAGVNVLTASDNVQDPFGPFGRADTLEAAWLTGLAAHMGPEEIPLLLDMVTTRAARAVGIPGEYGIQEGAPADLVVMDAVSAENLVVERPERWLVLRAGEVVYARPGDGGLDADP